MAVEQNLAHLSNTLVYSAMLVYTGALGAYVTDLSSRGKVARAGESPVETPAEARVVEREAVTVGGARSSTPSDDDVAVAEQAGPGAGGTVPSSSRALGVAMSLTWLAFGLHLAGVITRGVAAHRAPWGNMYEFSTAGAVVVTAVFLAVCLRRDVRYLGTFIVGPVLLTLGLAVTVLYTEAAQLVPALHSFWLVIHVSIAFVASALFTLGFSTTVLQLVQERRETAREAGRTPRGGRFMDVLPTSVELERSAYRLHVAAFPLWGFTLIAGAIWAEAAWGRYWNWDPKEVWTFIIWVVYAGYLHARATRGWDGRRAAYWAMAGYGCILFNFLVVNIWFVGKHSYAGV